VTIGDALAGGAKVVTVGGEAMCGRYAASVGVQAGCDRVGGISSRCSGVFVAMNDDDAADYIVALALRENARERHSSHLRYGHYHAHQQLLYWGQLEAGIKMALDQQYCVQQRRQQRLYHTVVANEP
jgi:hypothetical protein